jgi:hypothetical protein
MHRPINHIFSPSNRFSPPDKAEAEALLDFDFRPFLTVDRNRPISPSPDKAVVPPGRLFGRG